MADDINTSYGRCLKTGHFFQDFYRVFVNSNPKFATMFANTNFERQHELLRQGLNFIISYNKGSGFAQTQLEKIGKSHSKTAMNIDPNLYKYWEKALLETIKSNDTQMTPELEKQWAECIKKGTDFIKSLY